MTDEQTGEVSEAVEATTTDVPESESQPEVVDQQPEETQSPESETGENEVDEQPPKDNKAWAAMRAENKRLSEAVEAIDPEYLEKLRGAVAPQEPIAPQFNPVSEDADYTEVTQRLNWTQQQAMSANQQLARMQQQLELQQDRMAEDAFPALKSDKEFQQLVAEKKLAARVLGKDVTTTEIARQVSKLLSRRDEQVAVQAAQTTKQQIIDKQAATAEAKGQSSGGQSAVKDDELRRKVRMGNTEAEQELASRLIADLEF